MILPKQAQGKNNSLEHLSKLVNNYWLGKKLIERKL